MKLISKMIAHLNLHLLMINEYQYLKQDHALCEVKKHPHM